MLSHASQSLSAFYQASTFIVEALAMISHGKHGENHDNIYGDWDITNLKEAQKFLANITGFDFIVVFMISYQYLSHLAGSTIQLQNTTLGIIQVHQMIRTIKELYEIAARGYRGQLKAHLRAGSYAI